MDEIIRFWIGFALIATSGIAAAIGWAIKNHQFSNSKRAESLPLESSIPEESDLMDKESED